MWPNPAVTVASPEDPQLYIYIYIERDTCSVSSLFLNWRDYKKLYIYILAVFSSTD